MNPTPIASDMTGYSTGMLSSSLLIYAGVFIAIILIVIWRAKGVVQSAFGFVLLLL